MLYIVFASSLKRGQIFPESAVREARAAARRWARVDTNTIFAPVPDSFVCPDKLFQASFDIGEKSFIAFY